MKIPISIKIPEHWLPLVDALARADRRRRSAYIRLILERHLINLLGKSRKELDD